MSGERLQQCNSKEACVTLFSVLVFIGLPLSSDAVTSSTSTRLHAMPTTGSMRSRHVKCQMIQIRPTYSTVDTQ